MATEKLKLYELYQIINGNIKVKIILTGVYKYPIFEGKMKDLISWEFYSPFSDSVCDVILKEGPVLHIEMYNDNFL